MIKQLRMTDERATLIKTRFKEKNTLIKITDLSATSCDIDYRFARK